MIQIYCLVDPRNNKPFYVGATKVLLKERLSGHISDTTSYSFVLKNCPDKHHGKKHDIILDILECSSKPRIDLIYCCDIHSAEFYEQFFFHMLLAQGFQIVNYQRKIRYDKYKAKINPGYFK